MKIKCVSLIIGVILFICGMTAGCYDEKDMDVNIITPETVKLDPVTLTFYMIGTEKKDTKEVLDKVAEATKLNIKLDFKWIYGGYSQAVRSAIAANGNIDAFICGRPEPGGINVYEMFKNSQVKDITELLPTYAPVIMKVISEEGLELPRTEGKIIAVPSLEPPSVDILGVYVKKDVVDKYNVTAINTFHDYENLLKKVKEDEEKETDNENNNSNGACIPGILTGGNYKYDIDFFANAYGYVILDYSQHLVYKWDDPSMKIIPWEQTPEFAETTDMISRWYKIGYMRQINGQEKIASFMGICGNHTEGPTELDFYNNGDKVVYNYYIPYINIKRQKVSSFNSTSIGTVAFNSNSQNTERALMFLNWIQSSQENYDLFNYGIKDRHYILKGEKIGMPEGMMLSQNPYWWHGLNNNLLNMAFRNINFDRSPIDDSVQGKDSSDNKDSSIKKYKEFLSLFSFAPHSGFYPDLRDIQDECNKRTQIYQDRIIGAIQKDAYDINETADIIEELKNTCTSHIVKEIQNQLDKWRTENNK